MLHAIYTQKSGTGDINANKDTERSSGQEDTGG